jgi:peptidoglycan/xylan/chitin deacetylase (PgdA/CDA1 family)
MKRSFYSVLHKLQLTRLAAWWNRKRVVILCYHGVTERRERHPADRHGLHIRADRFELQLDYLRRHFHVISLAEFLQARKSHAPLPHRAVVLTFDDGYRNFLTSAAPRLAARGLPVSLFLITDKIQSDGGAKATHWSESDDETFLSWQEVQALREQGVELGSHTCSHRKLSELATADADHELRASYEALGAHLSQPALPLAFPFGSYSDAVIAMARRLPYTCALTTDAGTNGPATDLFLLRRNLIGDDDDEAAFVARVSGLTAALQRVMAPFRN